MSELDGRTAFDAILQELLQRAEAATENKKLRAELQREQQAAAAFAAEVSHLRGLLVAKRTGEGALTALWQETNAVAKQLRRFANGGRLRRDVAGEYSTDLDRRLKDAEPHVDLIPF